MRAERRRLARPSPEGKKKKKSKGCGADNARDCSLQDARRLLSSNEIR